MLRYCRLTDCGRPHRAHGWCNLHWKRWRAGHPNLVVLTSSSVHSKITRERGRAAEQPCIDCGNAAAHWSYRFGDPDELLDSKGYPYSLDVEYYDPRCHSCHKRYDLRAPRAAPPEPPIVRWSPLVGAF